MKRLFYCLLSVLLSIQACTCVLHADDTKTYTPDDFMYDSIYHFKAGDKISFNGDEFEVNIYKDTKQEIGSVNEYVFDSDVTASILNYSLEEGNKYIGLNIEYTITFDLSGKGDNFIDYSKYYWSNSRQSGESFAALPAVPTAKNYMFEYWCSDPELNNAIDDWDSYGEHQVFEDTTLYAKWTKVELRCIEVQGSSETKPNESIQLQILPIADNERIYDVSEFEKSERPIICASIVGDLGVEEISFDEEKNGYFYEFTPSDSEAEYIIKFYVKKNTEINTEYCVDAYDVNSNEVLLNNGWPWGSEFKIVDDKYSVNLNTKLAIDATDIQYQWQSSEDGANYTDINEANNDSLTVKVTDYTTFSNCWFRCYITYTKDEQNYQCVSKAVKIIDSREINSNASERYGSLININEGRNITGTLDGLYISNDLGAYCLGSNGGKQHFNVLGKYNNGMKNYWTSASCDAGWTLYLKNSDGFVSEENIKDVICSFEDLTNKVNFKVVLNDPVDVSLYTDLCVGRFPEVYYSDSLAIKANLNNEILDSIHLVGSSSFENANLENDIGFTLTPKTNVSAFNIDALTNGPYEDSRMGRFQYISNDYSNEEELTYEDIFNVLKSEIFDYNDGTLNETYSGDVPFIYRTINGKNAVVAMRGKDSILSCAWQNVDTIEFSMAIDNAIELGINHEDIKKEVKPEPQPQPQPKKKHVSKPTTTFVIPKTGIN